MNVSREGEVPPITIVVLSLGEAVMNARQAKIASMFATLIFLLKAVPHVSMQVAPIHPLALSSNGTSLRKPAPTSKVGLGPQGRYQDSMLVDESTGKETREYRVTLGRTLCCGSPGWMGG